MDLQGGHMNRQSKTPAMITAAMGLVLSLTVTTGCQKKAENLAPTADNVVESDNPNANKTIGDDNGKFQVLGNNTVDEKKKSGRIVSVNEAIAMNVLRVPEAAPLQPDVVPSNHERNDPPSLTLGYPLSLLGENQVFGGVITTVSDKENDDLGMLKLTDLPPLHARSKILKIDKDKFGFVLFGCVEQCTEASKQEPLIAIPVLGIDLDKQTALLDLSVLGSELNLIQMLDPVGAYTQLQTKKSEVVRFDFSASTLVFDVEVTMVPIGTEPNDAEAPETKFTIRWYLRLGSAFNPAFEVRKATEGVGFFMTERSLVPKVQRFAQFAVEGTTEKIGPIHYFIKNVPEEHKAAFKAAFDQWNKHFLEVTGNPIFSYDFVNESDPQSKLLVPGDVRFNILEWDLVNAAPYGGLGPSIANQFTGEILSANVLIQGPAVIEIYTKWFEAARSNDRNVMMKTMRELRKKFDSKAKDRSFRLTLGTKLGFKVRSQMPAFEDPLFSKEDFDEIPTGVDYKSYMSGYFQEMVAHELGHNVGLRHNFRGNLNSAGLEEGKVSSSIMEYLGRGFRHLNRIAEYDVLAIKYGYTGVEPTKRDLFCTDEHVAVLKDTASSPECSRDDATSDPFSFFEGRVTRAIDLLVLRNEKVAPESKIADVEAKLATAINGLGYYASHAEKTAEKWTHFFKGAEDRPKTAAEVKEYTLTKIRKQVCDASLLHEVEIKEDEAAKKATEENIAELKKSVTKSLSALNLIKANAVLCE